MNRDRSVARTVGILYIMGTVSGIISVPLLNPRTTPDFLTEIAANQSTYTLGALMVLAMGFLLALIPAFMFPILKEYNVTLGVGYIIFRGALETVTYIIQAICFLSLSIFSAEYIAGGQNAALIQPLGILLNKIPDFPMGSFAFGIGALIFYYALFKYKIIPRWIPAYGIAAVLLHIISGVLVLLGAQENFDTGSLIMNMPIALQEIVMAGWFIIKGFNPVRRDVLSPQPG